VLKINTILKKRYNRKSRKKRYKILFNNMDYYNIDNVKFKNYIKDNERSLRKFYNSSSFFLKETIYVKNKTDINKHIDLLISLF
jgi:hypothetical protein